MIQNTTRKTDGRKERKNKSQISSPQNPREYLIDINKYIFFFMSHAFMFVSFLIVHENPGLRQIPQLPLSRPLRPSSIEILEGRL